MQKTNSFRNKQNHQQMKNGICLMATAAMRLHPNHRSEMVSQVLFGELFFVLDRSGDWLHVEMENDHYRGWIALQQVELIDDATAESFDKARVLVSGDRFGEIQEQSSGISQIISAGSQLFISEDQRMVLGGKTFEYKGKLLSPTTGETAGVLDHAQIFMQTPYLWGGRSAYGMDCSGLVQMAYKMYGISLARDAAIQVNHGQTVHLLEEARAGDLAFFDNAEEEITHTGILTGDGHIIHAHGMVRKDKIDHHGIFNTDRQGYTHRLRIIKRPA